ncbi:hypothetical protein FGO68_gene12124 [Halteria grandinella]|uniref:Uncharacterized protein n=1 Tax=Halteria grandinella TaxID=5974 RepID=A0A8J8NBW1_HALGN|nr:hypothetical protein FGO68_gene12124 [Halteria grandinella]
MTFDYLKQHSSYLTSIGFNFDTLLTPNHCDTSLILLASHSNIKQLQKLILLHDSQADASSESEWVHVGDFKGKPAMEIIKDGNTSFVQNLPEAEYVVAKYMHLKLSALMKGEKTPEVQIVTTEEGQRNLITEILKQKCAWHPMLGMPSHPVKLLSDFTPLQNTHTIFSTVWTSLNAPQLLDKKITLAEIIKKVAKGVVFCRGDLFAHLLGDRVQDEIEIDGIKIKDFRGLYKVDQGLLTQLEEKAKQ